MKKSGVAAMFVGLAILVGFRGSYGQDDLKIWKEFVATLKAGKLTVDQIMPIRGTSKDTLLKWLNEGKADADRLSAWKEWDEPKIVRMGDLIHFIVKLSSGPETKNEYGFSFRKQGDRWYFGGLESILIRLDLTPDPPTSDFPDMPEKTKAWQREEVYWSQIVYFHNVISKEKGKEFFLNMLKDGGGYFVQAKTWVPFLPPHRAFILFLCWEQSRLRANDVLLEKLTDREAVIKLQTHFFYLYKQTGHLKQQIPFDDYRRIFETIWQNRAVEAGWNLEIAYGDPECLSSVLRFARKD